MVIDPVGARAARQALSPEPFRYVGAYMVRGAVVRKEAAEDAGRKPNPVDTLLAGFAPTSLVPVNTE